MIIPISERFLTVGEQTARQTVSVCIVTSQKTAVSVTVKNELYLQFNLQNSSGQMSFFTKQLKWCDFRKKCHRRYPRSRSAKYAKITILD